MSFFTQLIVNGVREKTHEVFPVFAVLDTNKKKQFYLPVQTNFVDIFARSLSSLSWWHTKQQIL